MLILCQIDVLINQLTVQVIFPWCLFSKTDSADTVISNSHQIKQRNFFQIHNILYNDQYVQFVYMRPPVANPLNLPISRTFLRTMYVQTPVGHFHINLLGALPKTCFKNNRLLFSLFFWNFLSSNNSKTGYRNAIFPKRVVEILKKWAPPHQLTLKCPPGYRCSKRLRDWDKYRQELCFVANILGLITLNKNKQLPAQLKLIISIR